MRNLYRNEPAVGIQLMIRQQIVRVRKTQTTGDFTGKLWGLEAGRIDASAPGIGVFYFFVVPDAFTCRVSFLFSVCFQLRLQVYRFRNVFCIFTSCCIVPHSPISSYSDLMCFLCHV